MIISDNKKFIFIHIPKNAGMTIRGNKEFTKYCFYVKPNMIRGYKTFKTVMQSYNERDTKEVYHARWRDVIESYTSAFKAFAIVRNPWGKVVSRYLFAKNAIENEKVIGYLYVGTPTNSPKKLDPVDTADYVTKWA